jgi:hypothetical protein
MIAKRRLLGPAQPEPVRLAQKESNYRSITIAESCRQAAGPWASPERKESVDNYAVNN